MAHPRRLSIACSLAASVGAEVVADPLPDAAPSPLRTAVLAWESARYDASHVLVLQDDVRVATGFATQVAEAARTFPDAAIAFYANWDSYNGALVRLAASAGARWVASVGNEYTPCLALLLPARHATGFAAYAKPLLAQMRADDKVMARYLRQQNVRTILSVPALAEHEGEISIANSDDLVLRRAACFMATAPPAGPAARLLTGHQSCPYYRDGGSHSLVLGESDWDWEPGTAGPDVRRSWPKAREPARAAASILGEMRYLEALWSTAYRYAVAGTRLSRDHFGTTPAATKGQEDIASSAMRTLGAGGLLKIVERATIARAMPAMHEVASLGYEAGAQDAAASVKRPNHLSPGG